MEEIELASPMPDDTVPADQHEEIERVALSNITYDCFFRRFMQPNQAVLIESVANDWECYKHWINRTAVPPRLDVAYLKRTISNVPVPVADCGRQHYNSHEKIQLTLFDFLDSWECCGVGDDRRSLRDRYYLKDWHLRSEKPEYRFYETPALFASDWLNEYLVETGNDDYRFVYMGPKGTWTAFHGDVFGSFSWSVNIFGRKLWYLLPPGEEKKLFNALKNLPFSVTEQSLQDAGVRFYSIQQEPGDAIFVPSGWYHQVQNLEDAISVNHNWFNGCNVTTIWGNFRDALRDVRREIDDCRDMDNFNDHCQVMLKASFGMDYAGFLAIILYICDKRLASLKDGSGPQQMDRCTLGKRHLMFDLTVIRNLLSDMVEGKQLACYPNLHVMAMNCMERIRAAKITFS